MRKGLFMPEMGGTRTSVLRGGSGANAVLIFRWEVSNDWCFQRLPWKMQASPFHEEIMFPFGFRLNLNLPSSLHRFVMTFIMGLFLSVPVLAMQGTVSRSVVWESIHDGGMHDAESRGAASFYVYDGCGDPCSLRIACKLSSAMNRGELASIGQNGVIFEPLKIDPRCTYDDGHMCEGPNLYGYVGNRPIGATDPLGLIDEQTYNDLSATPGISMADATNGFLAVQTSSGSIPHSPSGQAGALPLDGRGI